MINIDNQDNNQDKLPNKDEQGELAKKYGVPVGSLACPHCGTITSGAISSPICVVCGRNMFEDFENDTEKRLIRIEKINKILNEEETQIAWKNQRDKIRKLQKICTK